MSVRTSASPSGGPVTAAPRRILVVDDEPAMLRLMRVILEGEGYQVVTTDDGNQALTLSKEQPFDLVIHDIKMPKMNGLDFLRKLKETQPSSLAIVMTAFGTWETAVDAMRLGAYTHMNKPFDTGMLRQIVARALERKELSGSGADSAMLPLLDLVGQSAAMYQVVLMIKRIAPTDSTVLISGESGTGKELVARATHFHSLRTKGQFVAANCGAFTETLLESELFGHVKGAFTNAISDRKGLFDLADHGTLFLDEIGEMSMPMQVKFLRVLENHTYKPVGGNRDVRSDVRIIAATNRNLAQMVAEGSFREDLFHRLNVIPIVLPPLRERREDVPLLAGHFLARYSKRMGKNVTGIDESVVRALIDFEWPGNVRELENTIERAVALCATERITEADVTLRDMGEMAFKSTPTPSRSASTVRMSPLMAPPESPASQDSTTRMAPTQSPAVGPVLPEAGIDLERHLLETERAYIVQALERTDWNLTEAAKILGMTFRSIRYRVSKLGIERPPK